ncbi:Protein of unknown function [Pyronema omphalodes CBS 100304]|uniref:Uncharacterized protein n=1 Tax=Pyronema omphalodes (strain CBS 100304) TaxID=1076935 RepID=U4LUS7_PYROM|nr:Protein of unknown function [Pyronema omphalodes CBS 100304]
MFNKRNTTHDEIQKEIDELRPQICSLKEVVEARSFPVRSRKHDAPVPESSQVAAIQRASPAANSSQDLTDQVGAGKPVAGANNLLYLSGPQDQH